MTKGNQSAWFRRGARLSVISLALLLPTVALAWFCGASGRMTGGGKLVQLTDDQNNLLDVVNSPVTNGYELHCDGRLPNNLEVNNHDPNGEHFHLDTLQSAHCFTTGDGPKPPAAGFDTFDGLGIGTYSNGNNRTAACAEWRFYDGGGPGQNNSSYIRITDPKGADTSGIHICPDCGDPIDVVATPQCPGEVLLFVPWQTPLRGQNQAHK